MIFSVHGRPTILLIGNRFTYLNGEDVTDRDDLLVVPKTIRERYMGRPRQNRPVSRRPKVDGWLTFREMSQLTASCGLPGLSYFRVRTIAERAGVKISKIHGASRIERRFLPMFQELCQRQIAPRISPDKQEAFIELLSEGFSVRETASIVEVSMRTVWRYRTMKFGEHPCLPSMRSDRAMVKTLMRYSRR